MAASSPAARSLWNGTITFGLVSVPIKVHSATEDKGVHFHEVHAHDGARIQHKRICSKDGKEVPPKEIVKGYEVSRGKYVVLEKEEIAAAAGPASRLIEIEDFVCADEIDPVYYDKTYYLGASDAPDAYRLLHDALEKAGRAGIGRWVFHNREYLVAIRPYEKALVLHTMRFADELVPVKDLDTPKAGSKPSPKEIKMAAGLVDALHETFKAGDFEDTYREAVLKLIKDKAAGKEIELAHPDEGSEPDDLSAALEASVKAMAT
jgi:DNA end-binding protein Ku